MRYGSLFTGIGGIDLGLERAGMECAWQVENDPYCIKVLEKHWPNIRRYEDVRSVTSPEPVDLLAGGFPCQPHSVAGKRRGAEDDRNLWPEYLRLIRETRPRYIIAENVPGIVSTYIDTVLSDLESEGYACWTFNLPACAFDAPHRRERIFIVGYTEHVRLDAAEITRSIAQGSNNGASGQEQTGQPARSGEQLPLVAHADGIHQRARKRPEQPQGYTAGKRACDGSNDVAHAERERRCGGDTAGQHAKNVGQPSRREGAGFWHVEPDVGRVAHGVPKRVDRLRGLGNAVVPQVAEWIGERIMEHSTVEVIE